MFVWNKILTIVENRKSNFKKKALTFFNEYLALVVLLGYSMLSYSYVTIVYMTFGLSLFKITFERFFKPIQIRPMQEERKEDLENKNLLKLGKEQVTK